MHAKLLFSKIIAWKEEKNGEMDGFYEDSQGGCMVALITPLLGPNTALPLTETFACRGFSVISTLSSRMHCV